MSDSASRAYRIAIQQELRLLEEEITRRIAGEPGDAPRGYRLLGDLPALVRGIAERDTEQREEMELLRRSVPGLRESVRGLERLSQLSRQINATLELDELLKLLVELTAGVVPNEGCVVLLHEAASGAYRKAVTHRLGDDALRAIQLQLDAGILASMDLRSGPVIVPDLTLAARAGGVEHSLLLVPLHHRDGPLGLLAMLSRQPRLAFFQHDLDLLGMLANAVSVAIGNAQMFEEINRLAVTDDLTQLANSRHLSNFLERAVTEATGDGSRVSLLFMDLDGFKQVNDVHGHHMGSAVLKEVAGVLRECVGPDALLARFGGDEFVAVLPRTEAFSAYRVGERMRAAIAAHSFLADHGRRATLTISVGVATYPDHARSGTELVARADGAMYAVKNAAKDGVSLADTRTA